MATETMLPCTLPSEAPHTEAERGQERGGRGRGNLYSLQLKQERRNRWFQQNQREASRRGAVRPQGSLAKARMALPSVSWPVT
jgi:hypothetical protein